MITLKRLGLRTHVVSLHEDTGSGSQLDLVEDIFGLVTNFDFSALFLLRNFILLASLQFDNRDGDVPGRWSPRKEVGRDREREDSSSCRADVSRRNDRGSARGGGRVASSGHRSSGDVNRPAGRRRNRGTAAVVVGRQDGCRDNTFLDLKFLY